MFLMNNISPLLVHQTPKKSIVTTLYPMIIKHQMRNIWCFSRDLGNIQYNMQTRQPSIVYVCLRDRGRPCESWVEVDEDEEH